ncbi:MAG: hypothetical protein R6X02_32050, partial [Enhygromyxa sp.]
MRARDVTSIGLILGLALGLGLGLASLGCTAKGPKADDAGVSAAEPAPEPAPKIYSAFFQYLITGQRLLEQDQVSG